MAHIYKITSPDNKVYVGSSVNVHKRWQAHKSQKRLSHRKLIESFNIHGVENHKFEIITECLESEMKELETYHGLLLNVLDKDKGLNFALPKLKDGRGGCSSEKIRWNKGKKTGIAAWNRGIPMSQEVKEKMSSVLKGKKAWNKGKTFSEESKKKMSLSHKETYEYKGVHTKFQHNARVIMCIETGVFYYSSNDASKYSNYARQTINYMLDGKFRNKTTLRYV